jgi:hypothetical protein
MKKIFTYLSITYLIPLVTNAQFERGQKLIGGNVSVASVSGNSTQAFDNRSTYHVSNTGALINPSISKFYKPTLLRGVGLIYSYGNYLNKEELPDNGNGYKYYSHSAGINIFSQRFIPLGNNFFFTFQISGTFLYSFAKQSDFITKAFTKSNGYSLTAGLAPGISYKINNRFLFDAFLSNLLSAGYSHSNAVTNYPLPRETKTHSNGFNIQSSLSSTTLGNIGVGFRWLLKRR